MNEVGREFWEWVVAQKVDGCTTEIVDDEHIALHKGGVTAKVSFYSFEEMSDIVELSVCEDGSEDPFFFLHSELEELDRAKELFEEMASVLASSDDTKVTRVLLCCTVGMTTSLFATRLNEVAKTLSLNYAFEAKALEDAKREGGAYSAVLLAPQVGFRRNEIAKAFPHAVVAEIPIKVFASYDAAGALRMLMGLLGDQSLTMVDPTDLRPIRKMKNDKTIMLISVISHPQGSTIAYRVYERFKLVASSEVHKCTVGYRDIEDVLATIHLKGIELDDIDAVGIALPGSVDFGRVTLSGHDLTGCNVEYGLVERFGVRVYIDNNANAGAVGCYVRQDSYDSVTLHTQQMGFLVGGQGTVANGHLLRGRKGTAGELGAFNERIMSYIGLQPPEISEDTARTNAASVHEDTPWRADRMLPILATMLLANIAVAAPDAIYISYDLIDDMNALREELAKNLADEFIPDLIHITDYHERIFDGEMALVLQRLNTAAK